ncbi:hypothetical protein TSUD_104900 [Trifolium subterraneum]|uniref:Uncharacterized protein n=1 Tax=Trifolium subterraneum TaxID=3900 RepID=A0A2Z6ME16_TRISU|nr:hypothetical protein TSUD_104900 [Trifolium subterraneum]
MPWRWRSVDDGLNRPLMHRGDGVIKPKGLIAPSETSIYILKILIWMKGKSRVAEVVV